MRYLFAIFSASITRISSAKTTKKPLYYDSIKSATSNTSIRNIQFPSKYMSIAYISARKTNTAMFADCTMNRLNTYGVRSPGLLGTAVLIG